MQQPCLQSIAHSQGPASHEVEFLIAFGLGSGLQVGFKNLGGNLIQGNLGKLGILGVQFQCSSGSLWGSYPILIAV